MDVAVESFCSGTPAGEALRAEDQALRPWPVGLAAAHEARAGPGAGPHGARPSPPAWQPLARAPALAGGGRVSRPRRPDRPGRAPHFRVDPDRITCSWVQASTVCPCQRLETVSWPSCPPCNGCCCQGPGPGHAGLRAAGLAGGPRDRPGGLPGPGASAGLRPCRAGVSRGPRGHAPLWRPCSQPLRPRPGPCWPRPRQTPPRPGEPGRLPHEPCGRQPAVPSRPCNGWINPPPSWRALRRAGEGRVGDHWPDPLQAPQTSSRRLWARWQAPSSWPTPSTRCRLSASWASPAPGHGRRQPAADRGGGLRLCPLGFP